MDENQVDENQAPGADPDQPGAGVPSSGEPEAPPREPRSPHSSPRPPAREALLPGPPPLLSWLTVGLLLLCLGVGMVSLVRGPHLPEPEKQEEEYDLFGPTDLLAGLRPEGVAVLRIDGGIMFEEPTSFGSPKGADQTVRILKKIVKASSVKAVVLRVNSPGGTVAASQEIAAAVREVRKAGKKVVVSMADMAASGGYYISAPADYIFANPGTITGSIGVITQLPRYKGLAEKVGYDVVNVTSGRFKDMGNPFRDLREDERKLFERTIMGAYLQFVEEVATGRARPLLARLEALQEEDAWKQRLERIRAGEDDSPWVSAAPSARSTESAGPGGPRTVADEGAAAAAAEGSEGEESVAGSEEAGDPSATTAPGADTSEGEAPEASGTLGATETPGAAETPGATEVPEVPGAAETPESTDAPEAAETPEGAGDASGEAQVVAEAPESEEDPEEELDIARVRQRVAELADGRIYTGSEALRVGLVDELGGLRDAIRKAGELAGLGPDPVLLKPHSSADLGKVFQMMGKAPGSALEGLRGEIQTFLGIPRAPVLPGHLPVAYLYSPGH